jgi:hypothetical protein
VPLAHEVEGDQASGRAGQKGQPEVVKKTRRKGRRRLGKGKAGRGPGEKERPPVLGRSERGGQVGSQLVAKVQPKTSEPFSQAPIDPGTLVDTDQYRLYARV